MTKQFETNERIFIVTQCFYGNRTGIEINPNRANYFLRGYVGGGCHPDAVKDVDMKVINVPSAEEIVIVYDQTQEDEYLNVEFPETYARDGARYKETWGEELRPYVSCHIPELEITLHTRCFACRMGDNGEFRSLEKGDGEKYIRYFPAR